MQNGLLPSSRNSNLNPRFYKQAENEAKTFIK